MRHIRSPWVIAVIVVALGLMAVLIGYPLRPLSRAERSGLDSLTPTETVEMYFGCGRASVRWYLSCDSLQSQLREPNVVHEHELDGGVDNLVVEGGDIAAPWADIPEYDYVRNFTVTYTSRKTNSIGEPPGRRLLFVQAVREPKAAGAWRIGSIGTGP